MKKLFVKSVKWFAVLVTAFCLSLCVSGETCMASENIYRVSVDQGYLALRKEKAYDATNEIGQLYAGDTVEVYDYNDDVYWWVYSPKLESCGYVNKDYLVYVEDDEVEKFKTVDTVESQIDEKLSEAYDFVVGKTFNLPGHQSTIQFSDKGELIEFAYEDIYHTYSISTDYRENEYGGYYTYQIIIDGEENGFEYFPESSSIFIYGHGLFSGEWVDINAPDIIREKNERVTFADRKKAATNYAYMNWNQFYKDPASLAGTVSYFVGTIININYSDNLTYGLIQMLEGDDRTVVEFLIHGKDYNLMENQVICLLATITADIGTWTNAYGYTNNCPIIDATEYQCGGRQVPVEWLTKEEKEFAYAHYKHDDPYYEDILGDEFDFTEDTIAGYLYTVNYVEYDPGDMIGSWVYAVPGNHMKLRFSINVNVPDEEEPVKILLAFNLYNNEASINVADNGYNDYIRE